MTKAQEKALVKIEQLVKKDFYSENCEIKLWKVEETEFFVALTVEYGLKNDEGTLAEIYCRDRAHLFIGKRGGVKYPVFKDHQYSERPFKWNTILQAVVDQR